MNGLDERIERALATIAESPGWDDDLVAARAVVRHRARELAPRRHRGWLAAAAATIVAAGAAGLWLTRPGNGDTPAQPPPAVETTVPAPAAPPDSGPESTPAPSTTTTSPTTTTTSTTTTTRPASTAPSLPPGAPTEVAVADPALALGEPSRFDPWTSWAHGADRTGVLATFVRRGEQGYPSGTVQVQRWAETEFAKTFADAERVDLGADVDGRIMRFQAVEGGQVAWQVDRATIGVVFRGDVTEDEAIEIARQAAADGPDSAAPGGLDAVTSAATTASVDYASGVSITMFRAGTGEILDASALAFATYGAATPAGGGVWDATIPASGGTTAVTAIDDATVAAVYAPDGAPVDAVAIAASLRVTPATDVPVSTVAGSAPDDANREYGESSHGRWLLFTWSDERGRSCYELLTEGFGGNGSCAPAGEPPRCYFGSGSGMPSGSYFYVFVDGQPRQIVVAFDRGEPVSPDSVERTGRFTLAAGTGVPDEYGRVDVIIDGEPTTCA